MSVMSPRPVVRSGPGEVTIGIDGRMNAVNTGQVGVAVTEKMRQRHAVDVARQRGLGGVGVGVRVDPHHAEVLVDAGGARHRADGHAVVAAEADGHAARGRHLLLKPYFSVM